MDFYRIYACNDNDNIQLKMTENKMRWIKKEESSGEYNTQKNKLTT